MIDPLAQTIGVYDKISSTYSAQWFQSTAVEEFITRFVSKLDKNPVVLDVGCGSGREIKFLTDKSIDCVGIDLSLGTIKQARNNVPDGYFRVMDARYLDYPDNLFDGVVCIAVVHHLYDRDFRKALQEIIRVTKSKGKIALTVRLGSGYKFDKFGRFVVHREKQTIIHAMESLGFDILDTSVSEVDEDRNWLQLVLSNIEKPNRSLDNMCSFCQGPLFLKENRVVGAPVAASVLWGDEDFYVTIDVAPLVEGHLLLCTKKHHLSTLGSGQDLYGLSYHKSEIDRVLKKAYNRRPVFLEHGTRPNKETRDSCIEHAHVHALPLQNELRNRVETRIGHLVQHKSLVTADRSADGGEYIAYENKKGVVFLKKDKVEELPSQFFRLVVADTLEIESYHWVQVRDNPDTISKFKRTLETITDALDQITAIREIISDIPQKIRIELSIGKSDLVKTDSRKAKIVKKKIENLSQKIGYSKLELGDLGERAIIDNILVPFFDGAYRGPKFIGDDAAIVRWKEKSLLATTDHCPKPVFFSLGLDSYMAYGWLCVAISLSDIAAMGGIPKSLLLNTEMPVDMKVSDYVSFIDGVHFAAKNYNTRIIGGNIREAKSFSASSTVLGEPTHETPLTRDGAEPGQSIFIAGAMGLFWAGIFERHYNILLPLDNHNELRSGLLFPEPKIHAAQALSATGAVGACMDASDGPTQAIRTLAMANELDFILDYEQLRPNESVSLVADFLNIDPKALMLSWGNFELVFTAFEDELYERFAHEIDNFSIKKIGHVKPGSGKFLIKNGVSLKELPMLASDRFNKSNPIFSIDTYKSQLKNMIL